MLTSAIAYKDVGIMLTSAIAYKDFLYAYMVLCPQQVIMFVRISGFGANSGVELPPSLRNPTTNTKSVVLALIRWLSPHPNAILRDAECRPVCPPPFDINHALWKYSVVPRQRAYLQRANVDRHLSMFQGNTDNQKRDHAHSLRRARYDLVQVESIDKFMNCTTIDDDPNTIMQTITLPFTI